MMKMHAILMGGFFLVLVLSLVSSSCSPTPSGALDKLEDGNARYVKGKMRHPNQDQDRRESTASKGQRPFATVLACSDSRVPVELIFDAGVGDIFVVRVAGNMANDHEVGSIEYGVDHLGTPVLVVLGHTHCGAVTATVQNAEVHGSIPTLIDDIKPAVDRARKKYPDAGGDTLITEAVKENVWLAVENLFKASSVTRIRVKMGRLKVLGAIYDIETGRIEWMGPHPQQDQLIIALKAPSESAHPKGSELKESEHKKSEHEETGHKETKH
jgi:carbonic anhydrase